MKPKHLVILGSTGSIGRQALEILDCLPAVELVGLAANADHGTLLQQLAEHPAPAVCLRDEAAAGKLREDVRTLPRRGLKEGTPGPGAAEVLAGDEGVEELIARSAVDAHRLGASLTVLNAIVGAAGLRATMATLEAGATLALANKESMVAGGPFVLEAAARHNATIVPVDSEHSALFQCLSAGMPEGGKSCGAPPPDRARPSRSSCSRAPAGPSVPGRPRSSPPSRPSRLSRIPTGAWGRRSRSTRRRS